MVAAFLFLLMGKGEAFQGIQNNASWVKKCQGNRLYINVDKLEIEEDKISVKDANNISHPLTHIFVDSMGIFTTIDSMGDAEQSKVWNIVWCRTCQDYRSVDVNGLCVRCGNSP